MVELSIIIVNYKSAEKTTKCIESIKKARLDFAYEIIAVDNASNNGSIEAVEKTFTDIKIVKNKKNVGMGAGNNAGIKIATGKYILILNDDIIVGKESIQKMYDYIVENKNVGVLGPRLLNIDGSFQQSYFGFPPLFYPFIRRTFLGKFFQKELNRFLMKDYDGKTVKKVDWLMGSCLLLPKKVLEKIGGGFDERFWMYMEDIDFCKRINLAGFDVVYYPLVEVTHAHGKGSKKGAWFLAPFKNKLARAHIISWLKYSWKWKF